MSSNEALRQRLVRRIDALLARPFLVGGEDRALLSALRGYVVGMTDTDLQRLESFIPYTEEQDMSKQNQPQQPQQPQQPANPPQQPAKPDDKGKKAPGDRKGGTEGDKEDGENASVGHDGLMPLPTSLPGSLWSDMAKLFRGQLTDAKYVTHLAAHCACYALYMWEGEQPQPVGNAAKKKLTPDEAAELCDQQAARGDAHDPKGAIPWLQLAMLALQILQEWLSKQGQ